MVRILCSIFTAWLVSFGLFAFMAVMIPKDKDKQAASQEFAVFIEIVSMPDDSPIVPQAKTLPPKPQKTTMLTSIIPAPEPVELNKLDAPVHNLPEIVTQVKLEKIEVNKQYTTPAHPIVRSLPRYPLNAALAQLEGWVKVAFEINPNGEVINPHVIDSSPPGVFDQAALDAIVSWRYKPRFEEGKYLHQKNLLVQINFDL